jgi:hypothetical protein
LLDKLSEYACMAIVNTAWIKFLFPIKAAWKGISRKVALVSAYVCSSERIHA